MQLTGPRSVSSAVRVGLDIFRGLMLCALAALVLVACGIALALFTPALLGGQAEALLDEAARESGAIGWPALLALLVAGVAWLVVLLIILTEVRRVFAALARGDAFARGNARRLRAIGVGLVALELLGWLASAAEPMFQEAERWSPPVNPTGWFAIAVVFILAEVFREGARLRRQSELTI